MKKVLFSSLIATLFFLLYSFLCFSSDATLKAERQDIGFKNLVLVGDLRKETREGDSTYVGEQCKQWTFDKRDLSGLLKKMKKVNSSEWYTLCYNFPCWYTGTVQNAHEKFKIEINSGSYIILSNRNTTYHFIMLEKNPLFLESCNCCEGE